MHVWVPLDVLVSQTTREIRHPHHHPGAIELKEKKKMKEMKEKIDIEKQRKEGDSKAERKKEEPRDKKES